MCKMSENSFDGGWSLRKQLKRWKQWNVIPRHPADCVKSLKKWTQHWEMWVGSFKKKEKKKKSVPLNEM